MTYFLLESDFDKEDTQNLIKDIALNVENANEKNILCIASEFENAVNNADQSNVLNFFTAYSPFCKKSLECFLEDLSNLFLAHGKNKLSFCIVDRKYINKNNICVVKKSATYFKISKTVFKNSSLDVLEIFKILDKAKKMHLKFNYVNYQSYYIQLVTDVDFLNYPIYKANNIYKTLNEYNFHKDVLTIFKKANKDTLEFCIFNGKETEIDALIDVNGNLN